MAAVSDPVLGEEELAAVALLWKASRRELTCRFGGTSMLPALPPQSEVRLRCGEDGGTGDVVAFLDEGRVVVHRIVAVSPRGWVLTRGDARLLPDHVIRDRGELMGRVVAVRRGDTFVDTPPARASLARALVLWPLALALRLSPSAGTALIAVLVRLRRLMLAGVGALRRASPPAT
jgi:hypothetical protein